MQRSNRVRLGVEALEPRRLLAAGRFAVIGDYGFAGPNEAAVAELVHGWNPDLVLTVGDNNYGTGAAETIDANIGQYYQRYIGNYQGQYGPGSPVNRFFPSLGNHDWWYPSIDSIDPYLNYFDLPGAGFHSSSDNERYYDFQFGGVHFFAIDSNLREIHGTDRFSPQAQWLQRELAASTAEFQVVYFHHPPYGSGLEGSELRMRWPFAQWGADAVLSGHEHLYERLAIDGIPYIVNGLGGASIYEVGPPIPESQVIYRENFGATLVSAEGDSLTFEFHSIASGDTLVDRFTIHAVPEPESLSLAIVATIGPAVLLARARALRGSASADARLH